MVGFCIITSTWGSVKLAFRCPRGGSEATTPCFEAGSTFVNTKEQYQNSLHLWLVNFNQFTKKSHGCCLVPMISCVTPLFGVLVQSCTKDLVNMTLTTTPPPIVSQRWLSFLSPLIYWVTVGASSRCDRFGLWLVVFLTFGGNESAVDCESSPITVCFFSTLWVTFLAQAAAPIVVVVSAARWPLSHAGGAVVLPGR